MEERITVRNLRELLDSAPVAEAGESDEACRQMSIDFAEMKKNPMKVLVVAALSHLTLNVSN